MYLQTRKAAFAFRLSCSVRKHESGLDLPVQSVVRAYGSIFPLANNGQESRAHWVRYCGSVGAASL